MASGAAGERGDRATDGRRPRPIAERFQTAVAMIRSLPKEGPYMADNKTKLRFYALYKQATEGPCHGAKPGFFDVVGKAKWEAWNVCGNMKKEIAMQLYVEELTEMVHKMPKTTEVTDFLDSISPFLPDEEEEEEEEEKEGEEGGEVLNSTTIHRVDEIKPEGEVEEEDGGDGGGGGGGDEKEESSSSSSNEDYQESFQDLQGTTSGDQSSPWQRVSPESLSQSFEVVNPETPEINHQLIENPLTHLSIPAISRHGTSRERVNGGGGGQGSVRVATPPVGMDTLMRELRSVHERLEGVAQQLQYLSRSISQQLAQALPQSVSGVSRRERRIKKIVHLCLLLLGWPLLLNYLVSHFFRNAIILPLWMWSAISAAHVIISFILQHWGLPL